MVSVKKNRDIPVFYISMEYNLGGGGGGGAVKLLGYRVRGYLFELGF